MDLKKMYFNLVPKNQTQSQSSWSQSAWSQSSYSQISWSQSAWLQSYWSQSSWSQSSLSQKSWSQKSWSQESNTVAKFLVWISMIHPNQISKYSLKPITSQALPTPGRKGTVFQYFHFTVSCAGHLCVRVFAFLSSKWWPISCKRSSN